MSQKKLRLRHICTLMKIKVPLQMKRMLLRTMKETLHQEVVVIQEKEAENTLKK
jgi:hypothetical protein